MVRAAPHRLPLIGYDATALPPCSRVGGREGQSPPWADARPWCRPRRQGHRARRDELDGVRTAIGCRVGAASLEARSGGVLRLPQVPRAVGPRSRCVARRGRRHRQHDPATESYRQGAEGVGTKASKCQTPIWSGRSAAGLRRARRGSLVVRLGRFERGGLPPPGDSPEPGRPLGLRVRVDHPTLRD